MATKEKMAAFNLPQNTAAALTYVLGWLTGLIFILVEKDNKYVRFHAMQSIIFFGVLTVASFVPVIGWMLSPLLMIVGFIGWLISIYKAYNGEEFVLPVVGAFAKKQLAKMK